MNDFQVWVLNQIFACNHVDIEIAILPAKTFDFDNSDLFHILSNLIFILYTVTLKLAKYFLIDADVIR